MFEGSGIWGFDLDRPGSGHAHDGMAAMAALVEVHGGLCLAPRFGNLEESKKREESGPIKPSNRRFSGHFRRLMAEKPL